jgi:hypothetical protein
MVSIVNRGAFHFLVEPFGGHMLFLRNALFIASYEVFGLNAEAYGWIIFLTHLVNVVLVFRVARALSDSATLGAFAAVLWGTSPMQDGALGWYSVYGQIVAATLLLLVLECVTERKGDEPVAPSTAMLWAVLLILGATCFGIGIGVALAAPLVIGLLLPSAFRGKKARAILGLLPVAVIALYVGSRWVFYQFEPMPMAEAMVFGSALRDIEMKFVLFGHLVSVAASGLLRGFSFPQELFHPAPHPVPWLLGAYAIAVSSGLACGNATTRRRIGAMLLLAAAVYGMIALGRTSTYLMWKVPLSESARSGRYHYVGTIPLAIALAVAAGEARRIARPPYLAPAVVLIAWIGFISWSHASSGWQIDERKECRAFVTSTLRDIRAQIDRAPPGADVSIRNTPLPTYVTVFMGYDAVPGPGALFALTYPTNQLHGHRVRFVEVPEKKGMFADPKNLRLSTLLVPGDQPR